MKVPYFHTETLPRNEVESVQFIVENLFSLISYANDFETALKLFGQCYSELSTWQDRYEATRLPSPDLQISNQLGKLREFTQKRDNYLKELISWMNAGAIPIRDAAMTAYHFGKTIEAIRESNLKKCPTFRALVDQGQLRQQWRLFTKSRFPHYARMRHAVAHHGEVRSTPEWHRQHVGASGLTTTYRDNTLTTAWGRKEITFELSPAVLAGMQNTADGVIAAFTPAAALLQERYQAMRRAAQLSAARDDEV